MVQLPERRRVVVARMGLEPGPEHVEADESVAELVHLGEIGFDFLGIPMQRPLHGRFRWNPVRSDRHETFAVANEILAIEMHFRQRFERLFRGGCLPCPAGGTQRVLRVDYRQ
jgi:hypothetical protein